MWYPTPDVECDLCPLLFIDLEDDTQKKALDSQVSAFIRPRPRRQRMRPPVVQ